MRNRLFKKVIALSVCAVMMLSSMLVVSAAEIDLHNDTYANHLHADECDHVIGEATFSATSVGIGTLGFNLFCSTIGCDRTPTSSTVTNYHYSNHVGCYSINTVISTCTRSNCGSTSTATLRADKICGK